MVFREGHNIKEYKDFIINLLPRLYLEAGVLCIGWEFSNPSEDAEPERLVSMPNPDPEAVLNFGRRHMAARN